jgi:hypothetical protein
MTYTGLTPFDEIVILALRAEVELLELIIVTVIVSLPLPDNEETSSQVSL